MRMESLRILRHSPGFTITAVTGFQPFLTLVDGTPATVVTINVGATAAVGARNVIVTNTNLDTSVVTGGIFIK